MPTLTDTLASYLPALVVRHYRKASAPAPAPAAVPAQAALLFVDISGFTALAEQLGRNGPAGAESLSAILNTTFSQILDLIAAHGGDVVKFAGDALLAVWVADEEDTLALATLRAAQCALGIHARMDRFYSLVATARLALRIGVAAGELSFVHLGGVNGRWELLLVGAPLSAVANAEQGAQPGEVVLTAEAWELIARRSRGVPLDSADSDGRPLVRLEKVHDSTPLRPLRPGELPPAIEPALRGYIPGAVMSRLVKEQTGWLAELRRITVLFVMLPDLGYATAVQRGQQVMTTLQTVLYRYEGSVNKLSIDDKGVVLVAAFGLPPLSHEDDPARGVQAALAMQSALEELGLRAAVGVTTGRAFCGEVGSDLRREYTMIGDVVNLAARLMQAASAGGEAQVLCDGTTFGAVAGAAARLRLAFDELPPLALKGKSEPLAVYRARVAPETAGPDTTAQDETALVGRAAERAQLSTLIYELLRGGAGTAIIEAEAGMGKSRLAAFAARLAAVLGISVAVGGADAVDQAAPYHAWRSIFAQLLGGPEADGLAYRRRLHRLLADAPHLRARLPLLNAVLPLGLADTTQTASLGGQARAGATRDLLVQLLTRLTAHEPGMIILEDAHWLDSSSWALALAVAQQVRSLALVVTLRPLGQGQPPEYAPLVALARPHLLLDALSPDESVALVCRRLGVNEMPAPVADLIREKAQGNPFFSEELAYALRDAGLIRIADGNCTLAEGADLGALAFPETVQGAIISRIDRLTATQQLTLKVASVVGRVFPVRAVHAAYPTAMSLDLLANDLSTLAQLDITPLDTPEPDSTYSFKHAITQDVVYNLMLFAQRRRLHRAVAEWYERSYPDAPDWLWPLLAYHWSRAEVVPRAVAALERAGAQALAVCSFQEARSLFEQAVAFLRGPGTQEVADAESKLMQLTRQLGETRQYLADFYGAQVALEESLALARRLNQSQGIVAALNLLGRIATDLGDYGKAQAALEESLALARAIDDQQAVARVLNNQGNAAFRQSRYPDAVAAYQEAISIQMQLRDHTGVAFALNGLGNTMMGQGAYDEAAYFYQESLAIRTRLGDRWGEAACMVNLGWLAHLRGDYAEARARYDGSLAIYRSLGDQRGTAITLNNLGFTLLALGDDGGAETSLHEALRLCVVIGTLPVALEALVGIAQLRLRRGAPLEAAELLGTALNHPAANVEVQLQAERALAELRPLLPAPTLADALARGRTLPFETVSAALLLANVSLER